MTTFDDDDIIPGYARDAAEWGQQTGVVKGRGRGGGVFFDPDRLVSRAEDVTFHHRYHEKVALPELGRLSAYIGREVDRLTATDRDLSRRVDSLSLGLDGLHARLDEIETRVDGLESPDDPVDPEPPVGPPVDPDPDPVPSGQRGLTVPISSLTQLSGKVVPRSTIAKATGGYVAVQSGGILVEDYYQPPQTSPQTGDALRIDAYNNDVTNFWLLHSHLGGRPNPAPGKHIDTIQFTAHDGYRIGGVVRLLDSIIEASASAAVFGKNCFKPGTRFEVINCQVDAINHGIRLYADAGRCIFYARNSDLAKVSLVGDWEIDVDEQSMPPDGIGRV
jgi:hypothetical protein